MPAASDLLATGGWAVGDAQARHRAAPDRFWLPSPEAVAALGPGSSIRLLIDVVDQADPVRDGQDPYHDDGRPRLVVGTERMWFWVVAVDPSDGRLTAVLQNQPYATHTRLVPGATVVAHPTDVIDLDPTPPVSMADELDAMAELGLPALAPEAVLAPEDPHRPPTIDPAQMAACVAHGVAPHRPWPFARCLLGDSVTPDSAPLYGIRARPKPDRGDCGWIVWTGPSDLGEASAAGLAIVEVRALHRRCPAAWRLLALPPGHGFVVAPGHEDVFTDPELLDQ